MLIPTSSGEWRSFPSSPTTMATGICAETTTKAWSIISFQPLLSSIRTYRRSLMMDPSISLPFITTSKHSSAKSLTTQYWGFSQNNCRERLKGTASSTTSNPKYTNLTTTTPPEYSPFCCTARRKREPKLENMSSSPSSATHSEISATFCLKESPIWWRMK